MRIKDKVGALGEELAAEHLRGRGHVVLHQRWRCPAGELDLVTRHHDTLVGVEVKTRRGTGFGHPLEAVGAQKRARLYRLLLEYAVTHELLGVPRRLDVIGLVLSPGGVCRELTHLQDVRP